MVLSEKEIQEIVKESVYNTLLEYYYNSENLINENNENELIGKLAKAVVSAIPKGIGKIGKKKGWKNADKWIKGGNIAGKVARGAVHAGATIGAGVLAYKGGKGVKNFINNYDPNNSYNLAGNNDGNSERQQRTSDDIRQDLNLFQNNKTPGQMIDFTPKDSESAWGKFYNKYYNRMPIDETEKGGN